MSVEKEEHNIGEIKSSFGKIIVDLENLDEEAQEITFPSGSPTLTLSPKNQIAEKKEDSESSLLTDTSGKNKKAPEDTEEEGIFILEL